ncbi:MAG: hypothetical protein O3B31_10560 [Chloroflexi bacterium]|nr:hypothetical protein [Chloroflexota bacterium]MDA1003769.1 hypothetical protein [Chloroflexota bacterium]
MTSDQTNTAEGAVERHSEAINDRDARAYLESTNFPFTYQNYNGVALTVETPAGYGAAAPWPWEIILGTDPQWHHTRFDAVDEVARSVSSAVFKITLTRIDNAGRDSGTYEAIWIATSQAGHWGIQYRHNLGLRTG